MSKFVVWLAVAVSTANVCAQRGPVAPQIGMIRDAGGTVRALNGVAGSFYSGGMIASDALAFAFGGSRGIVVEATRLTLLDASVSTIRSEPLTAAREGTITGFWNDAPVLWSKSESRLRVVRDDATADLILKTRPDEELLAICGKDASIWAAVWRYDRVQILSFDASTGDLTSVETTSIESRNVLLLPGLRLIWAEDSKVLVRDGNLAVFELDAGATVVRFSQAGSGWIQAGAGDGRQFGLKLADNLSQSKLFEIPALQEELSESGENR